MSDKRDERIEAYYDGWSARGMSERIVELEDELDRLDDRNNLLFALEAAGVDNWEGYETACQLYNGDITEDEL